MVEYAGCLAHLQVHAHVPAARSQLLSNAAQYLASLPPSQLAAVDVIILPECGGGYYEWQIVAQALEMGLAQQARTLHVVLMDSHIPPDAPPIWRHLQDLLRVKLLCFTSYILLNTWAQQQPPTTIALVMYCNGSMCSAAYCAPHETIAVLHAAVAFWGWCYLRAINSPVNLLNFSIVSPAAAASWKELSDVRLENLTCTRDMYPSRSQSKASSLQGIAQWWGRSVRDLIVQLRNAFHL